MGISPSNLSALVNGHKSITDATMDKAANAMNLELPDLGLKIQLPAPAPQAGLTITKEMWDELVSQNKRVMRLVDHLLDQPKR